MRIDIKTQWGTPVVLVADIIQQKKNGTATAFGELYGVVKNADDVNEEIALGRAEVDLVIEFIKASQPAIERSKK